jgi:cold shock CspA family protein
MKMLRGELYNPWFAGDGGWGFEILEGEFKDVVVKINSIEFVENGDGNTELAYEVISKPEILSEEDVKGELFKTVFTTIIEDIVREAVALYEQDRDNNPKESDK